MRCTPTIHDLIVLTLPPRHRCPLDRMPASRLLLPRSGLERSDFVRWHIADIEAPSTNVRYWGDERTWLRREPRFLRIILLFALSYEHSVQVWAGNFRRATRAGRNPKAEVMQFNDRGHHAQPQTQAFGVSTFV